MSETKDNKVVAELKYSASLLMQKEVLLVIIAILGLLIIAAVAA